MTPDEAAVAAKVANRMNGGEKLRNRNAQVQCPFCGNASIIMVGSDRATGQTTVVDCPCGEVYTVRRLVNRIETVGGEELNTAAQVRAKLKASL